MCIAKLLSTIHCHPLQCHTRYLSHCVTLQVWPSGSHVHNCRTLHQCAGQHDLTRLLTHESRVVRQINPQCLSHSTRQYMMLHPMRLAIEPPASHNHATLAVSLGHLPRVQCPYTRVSVFCLLFNGRLAWRHLSGVHNLLTHRNGLKYA